MKLMRAKKKKNKKQWAKIRVTETEKGLYRGGNNFQDILIPK